MAEANVIRRSSTVEISAQAAKGRTLYKMKIWSLRIFGFICLFFPEPISSIIGLAMIIYTLVKKDKTKLRYKVMAICPVCNGELYFSTDSVDGIENKKCDECSSSVKVNLEKLTITEQYKGDINLHQKEKMNYIVNKDVDLEALKTNADRYHEKENKELMEERKKRNMERDDLRHQRKKEILEIKNR